MAGALTVVPVEGVVVEGMGEVEPTRMGTIVLASIRLLAINTTAILPGMTTLGEESEMPCLNSLSFFLIPSKRELYSTLFA